MPMSTHSSFSSLLKRQSWSAHTNSLNNAGPSEIEAALNREGKGGLKDLIALLSPLAGEKYLEELAHLSQFITRKRFGRAVRLFAPLYLSNECNNICDYCGFSLHNQIARKRLSEDPYARSVTHCHNLHISVTGTRTRKSRHSLALLTENAALCNTVAREATRRRSGRVIHICMNVKRAANT